jgi:hypothetical protein
MNYSRDEGEMINCRLSHEDLRFWCLEIEFCLSLCAGILEIAAPLSCGVLAT